MVVGAGPAGLMAAEVMLAGGLSVAVYDAMPSPGRKFLLAGKGGLNLTHSESLESFLGRYGEARSRLEPWLRAFGPEQLRAWADALGVETFVGSSGRVFPREMKAAPLLRAWLRRLRAAGMTLHTRHRLIDWEEEAWLFEAPQGRVRVAPRVAVLALGGGSWPRLGSDGGWVHWLRRRGVEVRPLEPSNCGYQVGWSEVFRQRFAGAALKSVSLSYEGVQREGELVVTEHGLEGSLIYPFSPALRGRLPAVVELDLAPHRSLERLEKELGRPRGSRSWSEHLRRTTGLSGVKAGLLRELGDPEQPARSIKRLPVRLEAARPLEEAISSAGGVTFSQLDERLMLTRCPGVFCCGEMLDWEAPTGGYLLTACLSTGRVAGAGAAGWAGLRPNLPKAGAETISEEPVDDREREVLKSLVGVIWADGDVSDKERAILGNILLKLGYTEDEIIEVGKFMQDGASPDLDGLFPRADSRRKLMKVLCNLSAADGATSLGELRYLNAMARQLQIEPEELAEIRAEVEKQS